jgi:hypothetical protein
MVIVFSPAVCVLELRGCYGHLASFYYDQYGGMIIAVKFKPVSTVFFSNVMWLGFITLFHRVGEEMIGAVLQLLFAEEKTLVGRTKLCQY